MGQIRVAICYTLDEEDPIERELCELFPPGWLRDKAKETGFDKA
jgi:hypothetical protein